MTEFQADCRNLMNLNFDLGVFGKVLFIFVVFLVFVFAFPPVFADSSSGPNVTLTLNKIEKN